MSNSAWTASADGFRVLFYASADEYCGQPPGSAGGLAQFGNSGSVSDKLPLLNRSKCNEEGVLGAKRQHAKPYHVGVQVSCGLYAEVPPSSAVPGIASACGRRVPGVGRTARMPGRRRASDARITCLCCWRFRPSMRSRKSSGSSKANRPSTSPEPIGDGAAISPSSISGLVASMCPP
jgi:hypothetical protein